MSARGQKRKFTPRVHVVRFTLLLHLPIQIELQGGWNFLRHMQPLPVWGERLYGPNSGKKADVVLE
jgi:hypothetical protein